METKSSKKIASKQKKLFLALVAGCVGIAAILVSFTAGEEDPPAKPAASPEQTVKFDVVSEEVDPESLRISSLESSNESIHAQIQSLEQSLFELKEEKAASEREKEAQSQESERLMEKISILEDRLKKEPELREAGGKEVSLTAWERPGKKDEKHVLFEIPAGTVLKAILVSGADCSVAIQKPTGPNMVLLRPLDNGQLPRKVRVPLKGSVIIGNAIGDISSERVYIRSERMTLVERDGSFVETEVSAYVSGEDGREGMRGVVVDRSGQIVARAAFAGVLQGVGQSIGTMFMEPKRDKDGKIEFDPARIFGNAGLNGSAAALGKLSDYYIKRAEQLQPAIQIAAGRVVDVVFTKTVKIGEKDLKKKFEMQRAAKRVSHE